MEDAKKILSKVVINNKKTVNSELSYEIPIVESDRKAIDKSLSSSIDNYFNDIKVEIKRIDSIEECEVDNKKKESTKKQFIHPYIPPLKLINKENIQETKNEISISNL